MARDGDSLPCLSRAWAAHSAELRHWLRHQLEQQEDADDLLQEVFVKTLRQGRNFCQVANSRAWLFRVARHALIDRQRQRRALDPLPEDLPEVAVEATPAVEQLAQCLPRVLAELCQEDRLAIEYCDIAGRPQQELADRLGISLSGAKSRLQRARQRLRQRLECGCRVRFDENGMVSGFTPRPPRSGDTAP